jgi:iron(III) transport system ATP-binding protein
MLSGGQQQRIALARALAPRPKIMLLDEPLSNLDALLRVELRAHLRAIHREVGFTGIYVTHDQIEAFNLGTRVAVMNAGRIEQLDSASNVYERPATEYVARFLGIRNALTLTRDAGWTSDAGPLGGNLQVLAQHKGPLRLFVRPQVLHLSEAGTSLLEPGHIAIQGGRVMDVLYSGSEVDYVVDVGGVSLFVTNPVGQKRYAAGEAVTVSFAGETALLYANGVLVSG